MFGRRLNIEPRRLESHIRFFARRGFESVLARDLDKAWPRRAICFTFDDGFSTTLETAVPALEKHGLRGCFYVVTRQVGQTADWDGATPFPLANWDVLQAAAKAGHEIGNHTASHARLDSLDRASQLAEILEAETTLREKGLGGALCYPYGSLPPEPEKLILETGIKVGLSLTKGVATEKSPIFALPRVTVAFSHSLPALLYRLYVRFRNP